MPNTLRSQIPYEEFDYQALLSALREYKHPRDRITVLMRRGTIIRVKKGIYIFGEDERRGPVQPEILANLIYGPSYVSLEYALQHHGLIPDRVDAVTSVTINRSRNFTTPIGRFTYKVIPLLAFRTGVARMEVAQGRAYLMAIPEKALADKLRSDKASLRTQKDVQAYLTQDLRVDPEALSDLKVNLLEDYAIRYRSKKIRLLASVIRKIIKTSGGQSYE